MATLKEFEDALRQNGMTTALALLDALRQRDRETRRAAPARRVTGTRMTPELAHRILEMHASTSMTQQEIAFRLGVNQGRVNEVIKRGKWLDGSPTAPEAQARDRALNRARTTRPQDVLKRRPAPAAKPKPRPAEVLPKAAPTAASDGGQLSFGGL